ncbi:MAG TPA: hypothetical protein P5121_36655 [Caldilineaceae bacterium]|nr:hypothetical protein [Caldilineaceae bacterium]
MAPPCIPEEPEIYPSLEETTGAGNIVHTSQLALSESDCATVHATA